jgi:hypothetical protein
MFNFGTRFGDYAVTGGFFIFAHVAFILCGYRDVVTANIIEINRIIDLFPSKSIPLATQSALGSIAIAISFLSVFVFGMLLDIAGSIFVLHEMRIFRYQIEIHKEWVKNLIAAESREYLVGDFDKFLSSISGESPATWLLKFDRERRMFEPIAPPSLIPTYQRLEQLLISFALESPHEAKINLLGDQLRLCRISRAVVSTSVGFSNELECSLVLPSERLTQKQTILGI